MTAYFDDAQVSIHDVVKSYRQGEIDTRTFAERIDAIEDRVMFDCCVCSEMLGFPNDLRDALNDVALRYAVKCYPINQASHLAADRVENEHDHATAVSLLADEMHTIFHRVAERGLDTFSDDPRTPVRCLYARSEERREALVTERGWDQLGVDTPDE